MKVSRTEENLKAQDSFSSRLLSTRPDRVLPRNAGEEGFPRRLKTGADDIIGGINGGGANLRDIYIQYSFSHCCFASTAPNLPPSSLSSAGPP
jgi:hypothetical protein